MITITQQIFFEEISKAVFNDLKRKLLGKQRNHCLRVDYLPTPVMNYTCEKINADPELQTKEVEAFVLSAHATNANEIESGRLIELRNRLNFGVLVVFIPQGFRGAAEDSYDIHTFEAYDLAGVLNEHKKTLVASFPEDQQTIIHEIFSSNPVKKQRTENQLKYLLALKMDESTWETAGAYLHYLNLIPDLKLKEADAQQRIQRNSECVDNLSDSDKTLFIAIDAMVNKGLDPKHNNIKKHLLEFFRNRNQVKINEWTEAILNEEEWRGKISFDKWKFKDLAGEDIELYFDSFRDKDGNPLSHTGLVLEGDNLVATTNAKMRVKWKTNPRKPPKVSQFVVILERDEETDSSNELHRKTAKGTTEQVNFPFKDVDLEPGEEWLVHIRIVALDENKSIMFSKTEDGRTEPIQDISEPFYLRGEESDTPGGETKRYNKIRNIAEATFKTTYRFRKEIGISSQSWETGRKLLYRIKTIPRETYQIALNNLLYDLELKTLQDPFSCGVWNVDITNRGFLEPADFKAGKIQLSVYKNEFNAFLEARKELFHAITSHDASAVIEILDLKDYKELIIDYASAYKVLLARISEAILNATDAEVNNLLSNTHIINRLDTIFIKLGTSNEPEELVLMAPTHPLRLLWLLQFQLMLYSWSNQMIGMSDDEVRKAIDIEYLEKILPLNLPNAISLDKDKFYVNTDVLDLYWSIFPKSTTIDIRKVVAQLSKALGYKDDLGNISSVTPTQIADRLWRYLKHHPYIKTLKLNVINPGDGLLFLNTIRELQKLPDFKYLRYDIAFYGSLGYELMGNAFDNLMNDSSSSETRPEIDEELLEPSHNPLFPKLFFSKVKVQPYKWTEVDFREANVTVIIDQFVTSTVTRPTGNVPGSYFLHGLLAEYRSEFNVIGQAVTWSRKVVPCSTSEVEEGENISSLIHQIGKNFLGISCSYFDWSKSSDQLPTIQLELNQQDRHILSKIHEKSDWVFTIDRNFGIEYFDNPEDANPNLKSYLIDYTPEFMDGVGHRLIVSTGWLTEIEKLIQDGLKKINIPTSSFRAVKILDIIRSISGKLALKLINNPNNVREIIGLSITRLALEKEGLLHDSVLIPVDTHIDIFAQNKRRNLEEEVTVKRSDLILISEKNGKLNLNLIEVKFRSGEGNITESLALKEEIYKKNENSEKAFRTKFISDLDNPKIDIQITNKSLSTLIGFYFERAIRNGFCSSSSNIKELIEAINKGEFEFEFEKSGYIIHWAGISKPLDIYKGNSIYELGNEEISELLDIRETEIEDAPEIDSSDDTLPAPDKSKTHTPSEEIKVEPNKEYKEKEKPKEERKKEVRVEPPITKTQPSNKPRIVIGSNVDNGKDVVFDPITMTPKKLANQHLLIVGKSGAGKSQTTSSLLFELYNEDIPFLILDFQGEYISNELKSGSGESFIECTDAFEFDPSYGMNINPLELITDSRTGNKLDFFNNIYQVSDTLKQIFGLGDIQHPILKEAIKRAYHEKGFVKSDRNTWNNEPPKFHEIWDILEFMEQNEGKKIASLKYRVEPLFENEIFVSSESSCSINDLLKQNSIINLSTLPTAELMKSVARFVLQAVYNKMLSDGPTREIKLYVVIDEAHKLSYDNTLTDLIREARKYGVGFILASQSVRDFATVVFENMGTKISLQLEGDDAKYMAENFGVIDRTVKESVMRMLPNQQPMRALIRNNHYEPFVQVDIDPFYNKISYRNEGFVFIDFDDIDFAKEIYLKIKLFYTSLGFEFSQEGDFIAGSWWINKIKLGINNFKNNKEVQDAYKLGKHALELVLIEEKQSIINKNNAEAAEALLNSVKEAPRFISLLGSLLVIKYIDHSENQVIEVRNLTPKEVIRYHELKNNNLDENRIIDYFVTHNRKELKK
jgi:DNA phosphorothioation-dependent restriction protein DptH